MNVSAAITVTPICIADLVAEGALMPVYVHVIVHPDARVLVDTGITELHPLVADLDPRLRPLSSQDFDLDSIDIVVNTHLHFDDRGGNHLFPGRPIYVQRRELDDARNEDDYTIREWVNAPGLQYVPVDGTRTASGLRLIRRQATRPGHTASWSRLALGQSSVAMWRSGSATERAAHRRSAAGPRARQMIGRGLGR